MSRRGLAACASQQQKSGANSIASVATRGDVVERNRGGLLLNCAIDDPDPLRMVMSP